jgi:hypothetical protein
MTRGLRTRSAVPPCRGNAAPAAAATTRNVAPFGATRASVLIPRCLCSVELPQRGSVCWLRCYPCAERRENPPRMSGTSSIAAACMRPGRLAAKGPNAGPLHIGWSATSAGKNPPSVGAAPALARSASRTRRPTLCCWSRYQRGGSDARPLSGGGHRSSLRGRRRGPRPAGVRAFRSTHGAEDLTATVTATRA